MNGLKDVAAVIGVGESDYVADHAKVRAGEKPHDSNGYAAVAFKRAIEDAGVSRDEIDGLIVGGSVRVVGLVAAMVRLFQSGHIYHYAFTMIFGVCALLSFWLLRA